MQLAGLSSITSSTKVYRICSLLLKSDLELKKIRIYKLSRPVKLGANFSSLKPISVDLPHLKSVIVALQYLKVERLARIEYSSSKISNLGLQKVSIDFQDHNSLFTGNSIGRNKHPNWYGEILEIDLNTNLILIEWKSNMRREWVNVEYLQRVGA